jgi:hypothetical protein
MRFVLGLAVLALVFFGLAWSWWQVTGRTRHSERTMRRAPQVMIDVALSDSDGKAVDKTDQRRR